MSLFANLTTEGHEEKEDRIGGFAVFNTNIYPIKVLKAYMGKSDGGAMSITIVADMDGREFTSTQWVTNKKGENFFHPKDKNGKPNTSKRNSLPGFTIIDDLCLVTTGKPLAEQDTEEKVIRLYNREEQKELPTPVVMLVDLIDTEAYFAVFKNIVSKNEKNEAGVYVPTAETREENEIDKVFHNPSKVTVKEAKVAAEAGVQAQPDFYTAWLEKNYNAEEPGKPRDRRAAEFKGGDAKGGAVRNGRPGQPPQAGDKGRTTAKMTF